MLTSDSCQICHVFRYLQSGFSSAIDSVLVVKKKVVNSNVQYISNHLQQKSKKQKRAPAINSAYSETYNVQSDETGALSEVIEWYSHFEGTQYLLVVSKKIGKH